MGDMVKHAAANPRLKPTRCYPNREGAAGRFRNPVLEINQGGKPD